MAEIYLKKGQGDLYPADSNAMESLEKIKIGEVIKCNFTKPRNYKFHRKFFALLNFLYDSWEPGEAEYKGHPVNKSFERFREDIIILAGYYDSVFNINGDVRVKAKSISFGKMSEDEFHDLYSKVIDVALKKVLVNFTREDIDNTVQEILQFA